MFLASLGENKSVKYISGVVALIEGWNFNYSKCVFEDMLTNVKTLNKKYFYKFPRFVQMILESKYPNLERTAEAYDRKCMASLVFGLIRQNRKDAKQIFEGRFPLVNLDSLVELLKKRQFLHLFWLLKNMMYRF